MTADGMLSAESGPDDQRILDMVAPPPPKDVKPARVEPEPESADAEQLADDTEDQISDDDPPEQSEQDTDADPSSEDEPPQELDLGPVNRWPAEDREVFLALPPEAQEIWLKRVRQNEAVLTKKSQELAEQRRQAEEQQHDLTEGMGRTTQLIEHLVARGRAVDNALQQVDQFVQSGLFPQEPPIEMLDTDPIGYQRQQALHQKAVATVRGLQQQRAALLLEEEQQRGARFQSHLHREAQKLVSKVPELADPDPAKRDAFKSGVTQMLITKFGASPDEIGKISDHRLLALAADHYRVLQRLERGDRAIQKGRDNSQRTAQGTTPTIRPAPRKSSQAAAPAKKRELKLRDKMKTSGSVEDTAAWIGGSAHGR